MINKRKVLLTAFIVLAMIIAFAVPAFAQGVILDIDPPEVCFEGDTASFTASAAEFDNPEYRFIYRKTGGGKVYTGQHSDESVWEQIAPAGSAGFWDFAVQVREKGESGWPGIGEVGFNWIQSYEIIDPHAPSVTLTIDPAETAALGEEVVFTANSENLVNPHYEFLYRGADGHINRIRTGLNNKWKVTVLEDHLGTWDFAVQVRENGSRAAISEVVIGYLVTEEPVKPDPLVFDEAETYGPEDGEDLERIESDVIIKADGVTLRNYIISGDLIIAEEVGDGEVVLNNLQVQGELIIRGGGSDSIYLNGGQYSNIRIEDVDGAVRVVAVGVTGPDGDPVDLIIIADANRENITLEGSYNEIEINAEDATVNICATVNVVSINATGVTINLLCRGSEIDHINVNGKNATIQGVGNVNTAHVNADGASFQQNIIDPDNVTVSDGVEDPDYFDPADHDPDPPPGPDPWPWPRISYLNIKTEPADSGEANVLTGSSPYLVGAEVKIEAIAYPGWEFVNWISDKGDIFADEKNPETTLIMPAHNVTVTANYIRVYELTIIADPEEGGTAEDLTGRVSYKAGDQVSIKAEAVSCDSGWEFVNWTAEKGSFADHEAKETTFTMPAENVTVTANFKPVCFDPAIEVIINNDDDDSDTVKTDGSFDVNWTVKNTGNVTSTQQVVTRIILQDFSEREVRESKTEQKELTIAAGKSMTFSTSTTISEDWVGYKDEDRFIIELETACKKEVKSIFLEEAPEINILCGVCSTFTVDPDLNRIRLDLRNRVGNKVEDLDTPEDWKVEFAGGSSAVVSVSYDTDGYDFEIIVENMPAGTKVTDVVVTYRGYKDDPPGDIDIKVDRVNINTATLLDLQAIIHIGPVRAQQIIALREDKPFCCLDDLKRVDGIALGGARLRDIKDQGIAYVVYLKMEADPVEGGTAADLTGKSPYSEGDEVNIKAEPEPGWKFVNWTADPGDVIFDDQEEPETTLTMPDDGVTVTANFEAENPGFTVEAWIKWNIEPGLPDPVPVAKRDRRWATIVVDGEVDRGLYETRYHLQHNQRNTAFEIAMRADNRVFISSTTIPEQGKWYHLVGVYNQNKRRLELYVNGELERSATLTGNLIDSPGKYQVGGPGGVTFNGIDKQRKFDGDKEGLGTYERAFTGAEILDRYNKDRP